MNITQAMIDTYLRHCEKERRLTGHTIRAYRIDLGQFFQWHQAKEGGDARPSADKSVSGPSQRALCCQFCEAKNGSFESFSPIPFS